MKKSVACLLSILMMLTTAPVLADETQLGVSAHQSSFAIKSISVDDSSGAVPVDGQIPEITGLADTKFQAGINESIRKLYMQKKEQAEKGEQFAVSFNYDEKTNGTVVSLLVYTTIEAASATDEVVSYNFDAVACKMVDLSDVLGVNAVSVVDRVVSDAMKQEPDVFTGEFKGVETTSDFYVEDGECVVLFDKYEIAAGYAGIIEIPVKLDGLMNFSLNKNEYIVLEDYYSLKMLPLRSICEGLGSTVGWDKSSGAITITREGFSTKVTPGKNIYAIGVNPPKELESAPRVKDGVTYVPISFFETILGAVYSIDDNETITFSQYIAK